MDYGPWSIDPKMISVKKTAQLTGHGNPIDVDQGGTAIPYWMEDPFIRNEYEATLRQNKVVNRMDPDCARFHFNDIPVIVSHGAGPPSARIRQASSTSPQTGVPACAAASSSGWSGRHPGEVRAVVEQLIR